MEQEKGLINKLKSAISRYKFLHLKEFNFEKREKQLIPFLKDLSSSLDVKLNIIKNLDKDHDETDIKKIIKYEPRVLNVILVSNLSLDNEKYCVSLVKKVMDCFVSDHADFDGLEYNLESKIMIISDKYLSVTSKEILGSINSKYLVSMKLNHLFQDITDEEQSKEFDTKIENLHKKIISILDKNEDKEDILNKIDTLICMQGRGILNGVIELDSKLLKFPVYVKNVIEKYILIEEKAVMNLKKKRFFEEMEEEEMMDSDISEEGIEEDIFEDEDSFEETSMDMEDSDEMDFEDEDSDEMDFEDEESDEIDFEDEDFEDEESEDEESEDEEEEEEMMDSEMSDEMEVSHEEITQELDSVIGSIESDIDRLKSVQDELESHIESDEETEALEGEFE